MSFLEIYGSISLVGQVGVDDVFTFLASCFGCNCFLEVNHGNKINGRVNYFNLKVQFYDGFQRS